MPKILDMWAGMTGVVLDWALDDPAPAGFLLCYGQVLLPDTPHQNLRAKLIAGGFKYGDDGSGNPRLPDPRGRVAAGRDNMGGTAAGRLTTAGSGVDGAVLGAAGGAETHTLTIPEMPSHSHTVANTGRGSGTAYDQGSNYDSTATRTTSSVGGGGAHNNTQPTIIFNKIIKT